MGMDVNGKAPTTEAGKYFSNNVWWWHPLWDYCCEVAPDIIDSKLAKSGHYNDGAGLDAHGAGLLAVRLRELIVKGEVAEYAARYQREQEAEGVDQRYPFDATNVAKFAAFLEASGGFEID